MNKGDVYNNKFLPEKHKYKWSCGDCGMKWFSSRQFELLCCNFLCESGNIYLSEITEKDVARYKQSMKKVAALKKRGKKLQRRAEMLAWVK